VLELKQLVGVTTDGVEIAHEVDRVFFGGDYVGTIGRFDGANMCLVAHLSDPDRKQLEVALVKARAEQGYTITPRVDGNPLHPAAVAALLDEQGSDE
jgi:hypothetical protein